MNEPIKQLFKDIIFNLQSFLHWSELYHSEGEWTYLKKETDFYNRLLELNPKAVKWLRDHDFDNLCG